MLITELRKQAARTGKMLREKARQPWDDDLQLTLVGFVTLLNRILGSGHVHTHARFWFEVIRKDELKQYVPENPNHADVENIVEDLCLEVTRMTVTRQRTPDRYLLTLALCDALKVTNHPQL